VSPEQKNQVGWIVHVRHSLVLETLLVQLEICCIE